MKSIKLKLLIFVGMVIIVCSTILLYRTYTKATSDIENLIEQQLGLALNFDLAIREYVAETIRPIMYNMVSEGRFIPETMSTSFVARSIFEKARKNFPDYIIKFASDNPRNPVNQAGPEELDMIKYFNENPDNTTWTGEITMAGREYLATFSAMRMEKSCLHCHGNPADAPRELIKRYGSKASFYRPFGEVVGLDTIAIPSDTIKQLLLSEKFKDLGFLGIVILLLSASLVFVFKFVITDRLGVITNHFLDVEKQREKMIIRTVEIKGTDEIAFLAKSFNNLAEKLNNTHNEFTLEIEQRKQIQDALRQSEEKYRQLSEGTSEAIVWHDKGKIIEANKQYYELFGYEPEELAGKDAISLTATPDSVKFMRQLISLDHPGPYRVEGMRKDGSVFPIEVRVKILKYNGKMARMAAIRDLSKQMQAEALLRKSEQRYRAVVESQTEMICRFLSDGTLTFVNDAYCRYFGKCREELIGQNLMRFIPENEQEKVFKEISSLNQNDPVITYEHRVLNPKGKICWHEWTNQAIFDDQNKLVEIQSTGWDITERKIIEQQIEASLKEKEILLSEIHHRVKNNFEIISSLLDMASMSSRNKDIKDLLLSSRARIHSMAMIHSQLYRSDWFDRVDMVSHIKELSENLLILYKDKKKIKIEIEPSEVYLSLKQAIPCALIVNELITNSLKYAFVDKKHGKIHVSICNLDDNKVLLRIKDNGGGINESVDVKPAGSLGLELVDHLVVGQLKGEISIHNNDGTDICIEFDRQ